MEKGKMSVGALLASGKQDLLDMHPAHDTRGADHPPSSAWSQDGHASYSMISQNT